MEHYSADQLKEPVQLIRKSRVADGAGGFTETETLLPSPTTFHMAGMRALRGAERFTNEGIQAMTDVRFVMWADVEVRPTDVILYKGARYNVAGLNPPGLSKFREVDATSGGVT